MRKRVVIAGISGLFLAAIVTGGILIFSKKTVSFPNFSAQTTTPVSPTPTPQVKPATWNDPAGFTFQYPEGLTVNNHEEDNNNYAHVELTSKDHPGNLIVWAKDTNSADVAAWAATEKSFAGAPIMDTTIGNQPAKKVALTNPEKLVAGTIFEELLFMIDTTPTEKQYWVGVHELVVNSFTFTPPPSAGNGSGGGEEAADEEETLQ